jgi:hypothetical protein
LAAIFSGQLYHLPMRQILISSIIVVIAGACGHETSIRYKDAIGLYNNGPDITNYNELRLKEDSTYLLAQDRLWKESDVEFMGKWTVKNDTLVLFKGKDFSDDLAIGRIKDTKSDSLTIDIRSLQEKTKYKIALAINAEDLKIINGQVKLHKRDFWGDTDFKGDYAYVTLTLDLRTQNAFARVDSVFSDRLVKITIDKLTTIDISTDSILCKYHKMDTIFYSLDESSRLAKHNLVKNIHQ